MLTRSRLAVCTLPALCLALLAACSPSTPATTAPSAPAPATTSAASSPATTASESAPASTPAGSDATALALMMADSSLGSILVDGNGMTLYLFTNDSPNTSACTGQCLVNWPPLLGEPAAGTGVDDSKLGSFQREDGSTQASYNGWPLYYWKDDTKPGDVLGQNVNEVWFVIDRDGEPVKG